MRFGRHLPFGAGHIFPFCAGARARRRGALGFGVTVGDAVRTLGGCVRGLCCTGSSDVCCVGGARGPARGGRSTQRGGAGVGGQGPAGGSR
jgi:hypothetical protein